MQILDCGQGLIEGFCMAREGTGPCELLIYTEYQQAFCEGCARVPVSKANFTSTFSALMQFCYPRALVLLSKLDLRLLEDAGFDGLDF